MSTTEDPTLTPHPGVDARPDAPESEGGANGAAEAKPRLSLRDIIDAQDLAERELEVPEWGGNVLLRELSLAEIEAVRARARELSGGGEIDDTHFALNLVAATMADPDLTPEQAALLGEKSNAVLQRVLVEVLDLNGLGEELKQIAERFQD